MKSFKQMWVAAGVALLVVPVLSAAAELPPEQSLAIRQAVVAWLECEECTEGELEVVARYGELAVPTLGAALERGPSPASLEKYQLHLESTYQKMVEYARTHEEIKLEQSQDEYVKMYLENYRANYAVRSAEALRKIGGRDASRFLEAASKRKMREDVDTAVLKAARSVAK
ncbi:MAG TPA: hypothetical protein VFU13_07600 [Steroidobacteraceae bacterium]|nr:hypothetical protein [Steroidobacteraceae bacterium]